MDSSFDAFFDLVFPQAEKVARRITGDRAAAEDIAAEALARAFARWARLQRHPSPEAWVLRATINLAVDRSRRRGNAASKAHQLGAAGAGGADVAGVGADLLAIRMALTEALHRLPKRQRHVVAMRYLADMSEADVADALGISRGSVKTHLSRALSKLRIDASLTEVANVEPI